MPIAYIKRILFLFLFCPNSFLFAQDTIYINNHNDTISDIAEAYKYKVVVRDLNDTNRAKVTTYRMDHSLMEVVNFYDYAEFKKAGLFLTYWPNGKYKRIEKYKKDSIVSGRCFDSTGKEVHYYEYMRMPEFPGDMFQFLRTHIEYPKIARQNKIEGQVLVQFVVSKYGEISDIKIIQSVSKEIDDVAIKVVEKMPDWFPGKLDGEPVYVRCTLPLRFVLSDD